MGKPGVVGVYTNQRFNLSKLWEGSRRTCQGLKPVSGNPTDRHFRGASRTVRHGETVNPPAIERAGPETPHLQRGALDLYPNGAADKAESLAGCKSLYRQLPVFGRLAYPMRGEATNRVLLGRKSPGCPAAVFAAVGTIWGASKLGGRNITKYLQPRNATPREIVIRGQTREADPTLDLGKADGAVEETGASTRSTAGVWGPASKERFSVDNVGKLPWAAGTGYNLQGLSKRGQKPKEERAQRERRMSQYERRRRSNVLSGDGSRLPNGGNTRVGQRYYGAGGETVLGSSLRSMVIDGASDAETPRRQ